MYLTLDDLLYSGYIDYLLDVRCYTCHHQVRKHWFNKYVDQSEGCVVDSCKCFEFV